MKIIQQAKFCSGGGDRQNHCGSFSTNSFDIVQPAEIEIGGIRLLSKIPQSAAEALRINQALDKIEAIYSQ